MRLPTALTTFFIIDELVKFSALWMYGVNFSLVWVAVFDLQQPPHSV